MAYSNTSKYYIYRGGGETEDCLYIHDRETNIDNIIPMLLFDELVVMRYPQIIEGLALRKIQMRSWKKHGGSLGSQALARVLGKPSVEDKINRRKGGIKKKD